MLFFDPHSSLADHTQTFESISEPIKESLGFFVLKKLTLDFFKAYIHLHKNDLWMNQMELIFVAVLRNRDAYPGFFSIPDP
jgi:hypothetical protein